MRVVALLAALSVVAGWSVAAPAPAVASCAFIVVWHDTAYFEYGTSGPRPHPAPAGRLSRAVEPGCNDTGGETPSPARVRARSIAGVPPAVAVLDDTYVMVAPGYFPQVRGFPIRWGAVDDETATCRISARMTLTGRAHPKPGGINLADVRSSHRVRLFDHELVDLFVDVHTRFSGLFRNGLPHIGDGQRVLIQAVRCGRKIVARRISAAGRIMPDTTAEDILGQNWRGGPSIATSARRHGWWVAGATVVAAAVAGGVLIARRRSGAAHRG